MTTTTRRALLGDLVNLDPCGVPLRPASSGATTRAREARLPGLTPHAFLASVQRIEPPRPDRPLVWGCAEGGTILFQVDDGTRRELQEALDAGEEPSVIVEPDQIVALEV